MFQVVTSCPLASHENPQLQYCLSTCATCVTPLATKCDSATTIHSIVQEQRTSNVMVNTAGVVRYCRFLRTLNIDLTAAGVEPLCRFLGRFLCPFVVVANVIY
jgi:hypothetical protein